VTEQVMTRSPMCAKHGPSPKAATCEDCAWLMATVTQPRPSVKAHRSLTTFKRRLYLKREAWSLNWPACALFRSVR
jgi:hypothetical protein